MHVHPNQVNPNTQLDALYSAEKTSAKAAAERTRRKLMQSASEISGEAAEEAYVIRGESEEEESQEHAMRHGRWPKANQKPEADDSDTDHYVSDWA